MKRRLMAGMMLGLGSVVLPLNSAVAEVPVPLTEEEREQGWELLFNGENLDGIYSWKTKKPLVEGAWKVENGELRLVNPAGEDIYFGKGYVDFELELEWKTEGNSGIFLRVNPKGKGPIYADALEMQVMNDTAEKTGKHDAGALYDFIGLPEGEKVIDPDGWNKVRVTCKNNTFTHWLNGKMVYQYTLGNQRWLKELLPNSKFKDNANFGLFAQGVVGLQDHGDKVAFRNVKLRVLRDEVKERKSAERRKEIYEKSGPVIGTVLSGQQGAYDVNRGYVVDLGGDAGVVFNADTMQFSGGWLNGGGVNFHGLPFDTGHGATPSWDETRALFSAKNAPGWASPEGKFEDVREGDGVPKLGGFPKEWMDFKGYYTKGGVIVFSYDVEEAEVLDAVIKDEVDGKPVLKRILEFKGLKADKALYLADATAGSEVAEGGKRVRVGDAIFVAGGNATFQIEGGMVRLSIDAENEEQRAVVVMHGKEMGNDLVDPLVRSAMRDGLPKSAMGDARIFTTEEPIVTQGKMGVGDGSYVVDRIELPSKNPFGKKLRVGGFDFFEDGKSLALCTWDGDVWKVTGVEGDFEKLEWQLVATGLHESLGLEIVDDVIYTVGNDQITKHVDLNGDGETDFFACFNNDWPLTKGFHIFSFDLKTGPKGDFWFSHGSPVRSGGRGFERLSDVSGSVIRVAKDGSGYERYASGLRAPNGMGVGPNGEVTAGDNEGTFMPRCPIHWVTKGYFGGVVDTYAKRDELETEIWEKKTHKLDASEMPKPLAWLPRDVDNSGGAQVWVEGDKWGMPDGTMLHLSYGTSSIYSVFKDEVDRQVQGGVQKVPVRLTSSAMRGRFSPADGQLYVGGLKGWQTNAAELGGIDRVRFTGGKLPRVTKVEALKSGLKLSFNFKLDDELAEDVESYALKAANIKWSHAYGSKEYLLDGTGEGWSKLEVTKARLAKDGMSVVLEVEGMQPAHEMKLDLDLETVDGDEVYFPIWFTVHGLGE